MKKLVFGLIATVIVSSFSFGQAKYVPTDDQIETIAKVCGSNQFADISGRLEQIYKSPDDREQAQEIANVEEFVRLGGNSDPAFRLCLRNFEPVNSATKKMNFVDFNLLERIGFNLPYNGITPVDHVAQAEKRKGTLCASLGFFVCISYGEEVGAARAFDPGVEFDTAKYQEAKTILNYLKTFASKSNFQNLLEELYSLPVSKQSQFVKEEIINPESLSRRGIVLPSDIFIMRSAFADNRPTLFCVVKYRSDGKSKLTLTFDSAM